ncbi:MAG: serine/threonine-protein kinase [Thermoanaerobaculales bacterium]|jgi:serine/threonine-protein kinase|nr:serine/threonine-protein kinase [Thermoanaerobaculales bacterium]
MELVRGEEITDYCDRLELGVTDRLALLIQVCEAVHAAHRQLVVHRDLKPSNIMVDGDGDVKLLDFGIAKMLSPDGTDGAGLTQTGTFLLTPEYASPEQVAGEPIGTSSDVYSIGLVAYRLLTGRAGQPVETRSPVGIQQAVCLATPRTMSRAVSDDADGGAEGRARLRGGLSATQLARRLSGDLDVIVEKALRKEPDRRYLSAEDLAADLRRHLSRMPVEARGDRFGYRTARFVSRHKTAVLAASGAFLVLAGSLGVSLGSLGAARRSEARAMAEAESSRELVDFVVGLFDASDPTVAPGEEITARFLLDRGARSIRDNDLEAKPELVGDMLLAIGGAYDKLGYPADAVPYLQESAELHATSSDPLGHSKALQRLASVQTNSGSYEPAVANAQEAVTILESADDVPSEDLANAYSNLGGILFVIRRGEEAVGVLERAVALRRSEPDPDVRRLAMDLDYLGNSIFDSGDFDRGLQILNEAVEALERGDATPSEIANNQTRLGLRLVAAGRYDEAEIELAQSLERARTAAAGGPHPELQDALVATATLAEAAGSFPAAAADLEEALLQSQAIWGAEHPKTSMIRLRRGRVLLADGAYEAAIIELETGRAALAGRTGSHRGHLGAFDLPLAQALAAVGRTEEAVELARAIADDPQSRYAEQAQQILNAHGS